MARAPFWLIIRDVNGLLANWVDIIVGSRKLSTNPDALTRMHALVISFSSSRLDSTFRMKETPFVCSSPTIQGRKHDGSTAMLVYLNPTFALGARSASGMGRKSGYIVRYQTEDKSLSVVEVLVDLHRLIMD